MLLVMIPPELHLLLPSTRRREQVQANYDGTSSVGHVIESLGVPLTEVGEILVEGRAVPASHRCDDGDSVRVVAIQRPQQAPERYVLDVHLGALARRMRLVGLDTAYDNNSSDEELVEWAIREGRVLLTRDRGLLKRRAIPHGAFVRGDDPEDQLADVLDRFAPELHPLTRCPMCNSTLDPVPKSLIADELQPGTRRTYDEFWRCRGCSRLYWRGAHSRRIDAIVRAATERAG